MIGSLAGIFLLIVPIAGQLFLNLRIKTSENYFMDFNPRVHGSVKSLVVMSRTNMNPQFNPAVHSIAGVLTGLSFVPYSNLSTECYLDTSKPHFNSYEAMIGNKKIKTILSRHMKTINGELFITSTYTFIRHPDIPNYPYFINRLETISIKYNATAIQEVNELEKRDLPYGQGDSLRNFRIKCLQAQYINHFKALASVCFEKVNTDYHMFFNRSDQTWLFELDRMPINSLPPAHENLKMIIQFMDIGRYEIIVYIPPGKVLWVFQIDQQNANNLQKIKLDFLAVNVVYATRGLMLLVTEQIIGNAETSKTFYLTRYPGDKFVKENIMQLTDGGYLQAYASNEDSDIIIETVRYKNQQLMKGTLFSIIQNVYSFNIVSKKIRLVRNLVMNQGCVKQLGGSVLKVDMIRIKEQLMAIITLVRITFNNQIASDFTQHPNIPAVFESWIVIIDSLSNSMTGEFIVERAYNLFSYGSYKDGYTNDYYFLPLIGQTFLGTHKCAVLKQRFNKNRLVIKNTYKPPQFFKYANFTVNEYGSPTAKFFLNIEFFIDQDREDRRFEIWAASSTTEYKVMAKGKSCIPVSQIARGSFMIKKCSIDKPHLDYISAEDSLVEKAQICSLLPLSSSRIAGQIALPVVEYVVEMYAVEQTVTDWKSKLLVFTRFGTNSYTTLYEKDGSSMTSVTRFDNPTNSTIKKIIPLRENLYLFFSSDGSFETFNPETRTKTYLAYPGISCFDITLNYEPELSSSIMCLNENTEFVVYYITELLSKSVMNSMNRVVLANPIALDKNIEIFSSEAYPKKIFAFQKKIANGKTKLYVLHLEIDGDFTLTKVTELTVGIDPQSIHRFKNPISMQFIIQEERLIFHIRMSDFENNFAVYELNDNFELGLLKVVDLPLHYMLEEGAKLFEYKRDFSSLLIADDIPMLAIKVKRYDNPAHSNVLLINVFSPALETFPTLVLVRDSSSERMHVFPVYSFTAEKAKEYSVGLLHHEIIYEDKGFDSSRINYLFQFVGVDEPRLFIERTKLQTTHLSLFLPKDAQLQINEDMAFESHPFLAVDPKSPNPHQFKKEAMILQADDTFEGMEAFIPRSDIKLYTSYYLANEKTDGWAQIFETEFSKLYYHTCVDVAYEEDGLFKEIGEIIRISKPMTLLETLQLGDLSGIRNYDYFCRRYSKTGSKNHNCTDYGIVITMEKQVAILYSDDIFKATPETLILTPFDPETCTEHLVIHHKLITFCLMDSDKFVVLYNLIDLTVQYRMYVAPLIEPVHTKSIKYEFNGVHAVDLSLMAKNFQNRMSKANQGISMYLSYPLTERPDPFEPTIHFRTDMFTAGNKADSAIIPFYNKSGENLLLFRVNLGTGNLDSFLLTFYDAITYSKTLRFNQGSFTTFKQFIFNGTLEVINKILTNAHIQTVTPEESEEVVRDNRTYLHQNLLLHLPNYHSYFFRVHTGFKYCDSSLYMLHNPFAGLTNENVDFRPECLLWACVLFSNFGSNSYLLLYHLNYEEIRSRPPNFKEIFSQFGDKVCEDVVIKKLNVDLIPDKYKFFPLQIMNLSDVQMVKFDRRYNNSQVPDQLMLLVFSSRGTVSRVLVEKQLRVEIRNLYISSNKITMKVLRPYGQLQTASLSLEKCVEENYYKYWLYLLCTVGFGMVYFGISMVKLSQIQRSVEEQIEQDALAAEERTQMVERSSTGTPEDPKI